jgi:hypothetical protein
VCAGAAAGWSRQRHWEGSAAPALLLPHLLLQPLLLRQLLLFVVLLLLQHKAAQLRSSDYC